MTDFPNKTDGIYEISAIERQTITLSYITYRNQAAKPALRLDFRFEFGRFSDQRGSMEYTLYKIHNGIMDRVQRFSPFREAEVFHVQVHPERILRFFFLLCDFLPHQVGEPVLAYSLGTSKAVLLYNLIGDWCSSESRDSC